MKMVLFVGNVHWWEIMMSKCVNHLINRLWQNEPILRIFPEGGIMIWPEPREGPSASSSSWNIPPRQICGKDFMTSSMRADDKKGGLLDIVVWTYLNFLGNEIFQWKTTEIVLYAKTWRNWGTAACFAELQKSPLRKWHTILRRSPLNFKALRIFTCWAFFS